MFDKLEKRKAWLLVGGLLLAVVTPVGLAHAQEKSQAQPSNLKAEPKEEAVSIAPEGSRFLIPGRTLLIVSKDGSPPASVEGKAVTW